MAGKAPITGGLIEANVRLLRAELPVRFAAQPVFQHVIDDILWQLEDGWRSHQGMETTSFDSLNRDILPQLETLRTIDPARAAPYVSALVQSWQAMTIEWVPPD
jgi:hypothetical protein